MTREETLSWAKSLKPGDKVIHCGWNCKVLSVLEVKKVTPAGWIKTTCGKTFCQSDYYRDRFTGRGETSGSIIPVTDELLQEAQRQDAERAEKERKRRVIIKARNLVYDESRKGSDMTYERAAKIVEFFEQLDCKVYT